LSIKKVKKNGVVWLKDKQDQRGKSNTFSKIYRYLINSKLINNKPLKESLIIADNRENERVAFLKADQEQIKRLSRHKDQINKIKHIEKEFSEFKELVCQYRANEQILSEIVYAFNTLYLPVINDLKAKVSDKGSEKKEYNDRLEKELSPKHNELTKSIGGIERDIQQKNESIKSLEQKIKKIKSYEGIDWLQQELSNLDTKRKNIESRLTQIENQSLNDITLEAKISELDKEILTLDNKIEKYSNLLIHQISDNKENREMLNAILSDAITSLPKENIQTGINKINEVMNLFDGKILLPKDLKKPIESIDDLKNKKETTLREKTHNAQLLPIAKDLKKYNENLSTVKRNITEITKKIEELKRLPRLEENLSSNKKDLQNLKQQKEDTENELKQTKELIDQANKKIKQLEKEIDIQKDKIKKFQDWKIEIESANISPLGGQTDETSLDNLFKKFEKNNSEKNSIKNEKDRLFYQLKTKTESMHASEDDFIKHIDSEIATLEDKKKSIDTILTSLATRFSVPCSNLCSRFVDFDNFITNRFNSKIRKIQISDIDSLHIEIIPNERLITNLEKIKNIQNLDSKLVFENQSENLDILEGYLDNQKVIQFEELFDIKLHLNKNGQAKKVDLKDQIESDGTDKMIRLVLIMAIINQLIINDSANKIVIFVDEIGTIDDSNRLEMIKFCQEHNFIPISAAPLHPYDGFDKYYIIKETKEKLWLAVIMEM